MGAVIFEDPFTEGANTDLDAHTPNTTGTGWTEEFQNGTLVTAQVIGANDTIFFNDNDGTAEAIYTADDLPSHAEYDVEIDVAAVYDGGGSRNGLICARWTSESNGGYLLDILQPSLDPDRILSKKVGGTVTELATANVGLSASDTIKLEIRNATKKAYTNGSEDLSSTDNAVTAVGQAGWGFGQGASTGMQSVWEYDNFKVTMADRGTQSPFFFQQLFDWRFWLASLPFLGLGWVIKRRKERM